MSRNSDLAILLPRGGTITGNVIIGNTTVNTVANGSTITLSGNLTVNSTTLFVGNSSIRSIINATSIVANGSIVTATDTGRVSIASDSGGSLSIGRTDGNSSSPYIDFNTSNTLVDYDVRIQAQGNTATVGGGSLTIVAATAVMTGNNRVNGSFTVGNTTVNTSVNATAVTASSIFANSGTVNGSLTVVSLKETKVSISASDIDLSLGNYFSKTISGTTTFTVSNVPSSGTAASFILDLTNGGSATVNWWSGMKWSGGVAPTLTSAGRDVLGFFTYDGGTTWSGFVLGLDVK